ncbi:MAG: Asp-tRNA(Asn)/Glu-tRNA(Gln) amidotransferase subunit GatC [Planctomycetota bacterium]
MASSEIAGVPGPSAEDVQRVASLARLDLSERAATALAHDLAAILGHVNRLTELDVAGVEPMTSPIEPGNRWADGETPGPTLPAETVSALAPAAEGPFIAVAKVLGDGPGA